MSNNNNEIIEKAQNILPEGSEILYLVDVSPKSYGVPIDNISEYAGVYLESLPKRLTNQDQSSYTNENICMSSLQSFLRLQEQELLFSTPLDSIVKHPIMDYLYQNRNMLIDHKKIKENCHYLCDSIFINTITSLDTTFDRWDFFRIYFIANQITSQFSLTKPIDKNLAEKVAKACLCFDDNSTQLYSTIIENQVQQLRHNADNIHWKGINHEGFIESTILQLYFGETFEESFKEGDK